jgi:hypothetical protein
LIGWVLDLLVILGLMLAGLVLLCLIGLWELGMTVRDYFRSIRDAPGSHWKRGP